MAKSTGGRKRGSHNKGFFYRSGRGWYASNGGSGMAALRDPDGHMLNDPKLPDRALREAHARWLVDKDNQRRATQEKAQQSTNVTILQACQAYLANAKANGAAKTHKDRAGR